MDAGEVMYFSKNTPSVVNVLFETIAKSEIAKKFIGILKMFGQKRNVRIEVYAKEKAIRLIETSDSIRISPPSEAEDK